MRTSDRRRRWRGQRSAQTLCASRRNGCSGGRFSFGLRPARCRCRVVVHSAVGPPSHSMSRTVESTVGVWQCAVVHVVGRSRRTAFAVSVAVAVAVAHSPSDAPLAVCVAPLAAHPCTSPPVRRRLPSPVRVRTPPCCLFAAPRVAWAGAVPPASARFGPSPGCACRPSQQRRGRVLSSHRRRNRRRRTAQTHQSPRRVVAAGAATAPSERCRSCCAASTRRSAR